MRKQVMLAATVAAMALHAEAARADDAAVLAAKFGALPTIEDISLSPDGRKIAIVTPDAASSGKLVVIDLDAGGIPKAILASPNSNESLAHCGWTTASRLVCTIAITVNTGAQLVGFTRSLAINADGSKLTQLTARSMNQAVGIAQNGGQVIDVDVNGKPGMVLMTRAFVPESSTGSVAVRNRSGLGVEEVNTVTLARKTIESPHEHADFYLTDGHGNVRIMGLFQTGNTGFLSGQFRNSYRTKDSRDWKDLSVVTSADNTSKGFEPQAVDAAKDVVYGFDQDKDGFQVRASMALDGSGKRETVLSRSGVDVDDLMTFGRHGRVVGASYATDRRTTEFFDPELRSLRTALGKALPGNPDISFVDASADENQIIMIAESDTNPGMSYLYDKTTHHLAQILPIRAELDGMTMAEMKPIMFPAGDGTMIPGYLTLPVGSTGKNLPAIVMPHGGPSARDYWGFDWLVQFFAARGFAVLQPNYRGSSGYGSGWYNHNGFKSWRIAISDVNDAGRWLTAQGIAAPGKLAIFGWSYGGYAALQSQVLDADLFKAVVAVAPVTDLDRLKDESINFVNHKIVEQAIGSGAHIADGSPARHADAFKAPVLLFHGDRDQNVGVGESRLMKSRLEAAGKPVQYIEFPGLNHQLPNARARAEMLSTSDAFLRKALGL